MSREQNNELKEFLEKGHELVEEGVMTMAKLHVLHDKWKKCVIAKNKEEEGYVETSYASFEFGITAYRHILDNGGDHKEAMEYARDVHDMTTTLLEEVKHNPYIHSKEVVMAHDDHPEQKAMLKDKTMDKSALKSSTTVNQQLKRLSTSKSVHDTLEGLKKTDEQQQGEIDTLRMDSVTHKIDLERLREINNLKDLPPKIKAGLLNKKDLLRNRWLNT